MARKGLGRLAALLLLVAAFTWLPAAPASAQFGRILVFSQNDGEPTDPDRALRIAEEADVDLEAYGIDRTVPVEEAQAVSWFDALINLLRALGLLPA
jgi:hypothetical protein